MQHLEVVDLSQAGRDDEWQAYVNSVPSASQYHALEWREIWQRTFGHRSWYLMARDQDRVRGVLPMVEMKSFVVRTLPRIPALPGLWWHPR